MLLYAKDKGFSMLLNFSSVLDLKYRRVFPSRQYLSSVLGFLFQFPLPAFIETAILDSYGNAKDTEGTNNQKKNPRFLYSNHQ
jgi:hypothetical protein